MTTQQLIDRLTILEEKVDFIVQKLGSEPCHYCRVDTYKIKNLIFDVSSSRHPNEEELTLFICDGCYDSYKNGYIKSSKPFK